MSKKKNKFYFKAVNNIASKNMDIVLESLGLRSSRHRIWRGKCPIHGGNNNTSFTLDKNTGKWNCWSHQCEKNYGRSPIGLVAGVLNITRQEAASYLIKLFNIDINNIDEKDLVRQDFIYDKLNTNYATSQPIVFPPSSRNKYPAGGPEFDKCGISLTTQNEFSCFYIRANGRSCVPIKNVDGQIWGFGGKNKSAKIKWLYYPTYLPLGSTLFGIDKDQVKNAIRTSGSVIIVEDIISFMKLWDIGIYNVVSTFSNKISINQIKILKSFGAKKIILLFDPDEGGSIGSDFATTACRLYFKVENWQHLLTKDPKDYSNNELKEILIERAEHYNNSN